MYRLYKGIQNIKKAIVVICWLLVWRGPGKLFDKCSYKWYAIMITTHIFK